MYVCELPSLYKQNFYVYKANKAIPFEKVNLGAPRQARLVANFSCEDGLWQGSLSWLWLPHFPPDHLLVA